MADIKYYWSYVIMSIAGHGFDECHTIQMIHIASENDRQLMTVQSSVGKFALFFDGAIDYENMIQCDTTDKTIRDLYYNYNCIL